MILDNIRRIVKEKQMTMAQLCRGTGLLYRSVENWNRNVPNVNAVYKVARYLGVSMDDLMEDCNVAED